MSFFPHILQGPIPRYDELSPQLKNIHIDYISISHGAQLMIWGAIKKMVVADRAALFVDSVYSDYQVASGTLLLVASILYSIQIYADFSGCVDIAKGVAEIFGINLIENFEQPYFARSIKNFWRRWHKSLSSWFRDYLYIPLGGNRKGTLRRWINIIIVFLVSGLWHGVGINYIIWGILHGVYQIIGYALAPVKNKFYSVFKVNKNSISIKYSQIFCTFLLVDLAWIIFRVTDIKAAYQIIMSIFNDFSFWAITDGTMLKYGLSCADWFIIILFIIIIFIVDVAHSKNICIRSLIDEQFIIFKWMIYYGALFSIIVFGVYGIGYNASNFIYMNF